MALNIKRTPISDRTNSFLIEEVSNICPMCGSFEKTGEELTNHHINFNPSISEYWNLIRICQMCHDDLTKYREDGTRERRVRLVKRRLFRDYFGPVAISAMKLAYENGAVTASPIMVKELYDRELITMKQKNVLTVGPATNISTFDVYSLTNEGREILERLFNSK